MEIILDSPKSVQTLATWMYLGKKSNQERLVAAYVSLNVQVSESFPQYVKLGYSLPVICQCGHVCREIDSSCAHIPIILPHCERCQGMEYLGWKDRIWYGNIPQWAVDLSEILAVLALEKVISCQTQLDTYLKFLKVYGRM